MAKKPSRRQIDAFKKGMEELEPGLEHIRKTMGLGLAEAVTEANRGSTHQRVAAHRRRLRAKYPGVKI